MAASYMGDGKHETTIHEADAIGVKLSIYTCPAGFITIKQEQISAVLLQVGFRLSRILPFLHFLLWFSAFSCLSAYESY